MSQLKIIKKVSEVHELVKYCQQTRTASFDFETTDFAYQNSYEYPTICGVSFQPGSAWVIPLGHFEGPWPDEKDYMKIWRIFSKGVLENPNVVKIAWNAQYELKWSFRLGTIIRGRLFDPMLAKYLLDEERPHGLKEFVSGHFPTYANYEDKIKDKLKWKDKPLIPLSTYCGIDCDLTGRAFIYLEKRLIEKGFYNLYRNLYCPLLKTLAESSYSGIPIDRPYLDEKVKEYRLKIEESNRNLYKIPSVVKFQRKYRKYYIRSLIRKIELEIEELKEDDEKANARMIENRQAKIIRITEGRLQGKKEEYNGLNFGSPKQLGEFLFSSPYGLKLKSVKKTDSGAESTAEDVLEKLKPKDKSGFMDGLLKHRTLTKLDSTYISGMVPHLDLYNRVHPKIQPHGTVTSRTSSVEPNIQNIPRDTTAKDIKMMFIPPPGFVLVEVDYSQAELRLIAELSEDKAMIDIFNRGYNIHTATACKMFGGLEQYDKVKALLKDPTHRDWLMWEKRKKIGKSLNFSIVYLQGVKAMAEGMTNDGSPTTEEEAQAFQDEWFSQFPAVKKWIKRQQAKAKEDLYVDNLFGFRRRLSALEDENKWIRAEAERQSVNAPIQGASGLFTLFSMVVMREKILTGEWPKDIYFPYTVHDSIGMFMRPKYIHKLMPEIITICDNPQTQDYFGFKLKHVKMKVSGEVGPRWAELQEYNSDTDYSKLITQP